MFRLFLALNIFFFNLYACNCGFKSCKAKIKDSNTITNTQLQIPLSKHTRLVFSRTTPKAKILKHDPFLSLYLIEDKKGFKYPFRINNHLSSGIASIDKSRAIEGKILKKQVGLNHFAKFSQKLNTPALLLNSFCAIEGIVTPEGIIEKEYISRFLKFKNTSYADIGIRVKDTTSGVLVKRVNHFYKQNLFLKDDKILKFDSKKVKHSYELMRWILFSKIGSIHTIEVKRFTKILKLRVESKKRYGGGYVSDTFLEVFGIYLDENSTINKIDKKAKKYHLKVGDKLLKVDKNRLLLERNSFQFFITLS
ncbi:MAG: PDZ domain-containing protein [Epsilonproteobacteria bacterium]|nr:PDZ domain-containing protein [Campylobacterota bacterium]